MSSSSCSKIILIEDDENIRELLQHFLEGEGFGIESFSNGKTAIERLRSKPDACLILLDMMMPVMDGKEFMEEFKKLPITIVPVPVYLCSATSSEAMSLKMNCLGFMKKPIDLNALLIIVNKYCHVLEEREKLPEFLSRPGFRSKKQNSRSSNLL